MPNPADIDRLNSKVRDGNVFNLDAYRAAAARATMLNTSVRYIEPRAALVGFIGLLIAAILVFRILFR